MSQQGYTYADLRKQMHDDLRMQHPEWVQPNGESPMCDSYEARLLELLEAITQGNPVSFPTGIATNQTTTDSRTPSYCATFAELHGHLAGCEGAGRTP